MPFRIALSGLNAASSELRVIGNNVANASTVGFKKARAEFADIFAASGLGTTANAIGAGVRISSVSQQFTQGNIGFTDNNLDLAISGQGFFRLDDNGVTVFTRSGQFGVDRDGYVVNSAGQVLTSYGADADGNITGAISELRLDTSDIEPAQTTTIRTGINLDSSSDIPAAPVASSEITLTGTILDTNDSPYQTAPFDLVDNYGNEITTATMEWTYSGAGAVWTGELLVGGASTTPASTVSVDVGTDTSASLSWDPDGAGAQDAITLTMDVSALTSQTVGASTSNVVAAADGAVQGTFSEADASSYNNSTSLTVYDSLGASHLATMYFRKTGTPNEWESYIYVDDTQVDGPVALSFTASGTLSAIDGTAVPPALFTTSSFTPSGGADAMTVDFDLLRMTQYGSAFSVSQLAQDGYATGRLSGVDIAGNGTITARFTNGQSRTLGQIALANFGNAQGLRQLGDTSWAETYESGAALVSAPGTGSLGLIESGALEGSNVDLTEQLVGMITAQRNFQANAQVIQTADTVQQAIINIR